MKKKKIYRERYKIYLCTIMRHIRVVLKLSLIRVIYTTRVCQQFLVSPTANHLQSTGESTTTRDQFAHITVTSLAVHRQNLRGIRSTSCFFPFYCITKHESQNRYLNILLTLTAQIWRLILSRFSLGAEIPVYSGSYKCSINKILSSITVE